ncbi:Fic family protein [Cellulomonas sp. NTE-D12]|uniref:Fic family protein n=1 Tax=Cellulomonas sp. NTE-D12 TaxID=2962632 RepID=UPI00308142B9|nr:Fic family protein [Cellulomonas sp. NTE-D12]
MFAEVSVSLPPLIEGLTLSVPGDTLAVIERATVAIATLDATYGDRLATFGSFLIRSEAVSSSRIERENAALDDVAKASIGLKAPAAARLTVAAARAVQQMVADADSGSITLAAILAAHKALLAGDPNDGTYAGKTRTVQNWIGGSDYTPRGAIHVPPPPDMVNAYMADLVEFANRDDMPALVQAALVHAQFESIHPFTDGNGRIGRALINAVLRRRGVTRRLVVPIASALVADIAEYFAAVNVYREGDALSFVSHLADAARRAAEAARDSADTLAALPEEWRSHVKPRAGSTTARVLDILLEYPAIDVHTVTARLAVSNQAAGEALNRLTEAGVLHELTGSRRDRAWVATAVMDELDGLNARLRGVVG